MKRTGAQIVWECLVRQGVTDVFGYLVVYDNASLTSLSALSGVTSVGTYTYVGSRNRLIIATDEPRRAMDLLGG